MKIINLTTNIVFDLPKKDAENLLESSPSTFAKLNKNNKIIKNKNNSENTVLSKILDE